MEVDSSHAGDICAITGLGELKKFPTPSVPWVTTKRCHHCQSNEPTVTMTFQVNTSPFAGKEGKYVTSRQILERLQQELVHNVALRVEEMPDLQTSSEFLVAVNCT